MDDEFNFDLGFMSEEEIEAILRGLEAAHEEAFDELVENIRPDIEADEKAPATLNSLRYRQMQFAYAALRYITKDSDIKVSYKLHEPFRSMGSISVEGRVLKFSNPEWFARVAEFADNTEVYPLAKNAVRLTFTFHGLTKKIK